jgi:hypothetical protein
MAVTKITVESEGVSVNIEVEFIGASEMKAKIEFPDKAVKDEDNKAFALAAWIFSQLTTS